MTEKTAKPQGDEFFLVSPSPHIHDAGASVRQIMLDVIVALVPALVASVCFFGMRALVLEAVAVATCVLCEYLARKAMGRPNATGDFSAVVTGLLLAFNLPPDLPVWMAVLGGVFAIVVAKQLFGGLGYNPFNPALAARAFLLVSFTGAMTTWTASGWMGADAVTTATPLAANAADAVTGATPLGVVKAALRTGSAFPFEMDGAMTWRFFLGDINGCLGETSSLALLIGGIYLLLRRVITWHVPASFLGTVILYAVALRFVSPETAAPVKFHLLAGGLFLGAFFMATDMVTTPSTRKGKVVFGIGCGILTMVIRTVASGDYPEGVSFAILVMNAFVPLINWATRAKPFGEAHA